MRHKASKTNAKWVKLLMVFILFIFLTQCGGSGGDEGPQFFVAGPMACTTEELLSRGTFGWEVNKVTAGCPGFDSIFYDIIEGMKIAILEQPIPDIVMPDYEEIDPSYTISSLALPLPNDDILIVSGVLSLSAGHIVLATIPETITGTYEGFPYSAEVTGTVCPASETVLATDFDVSLTVTAGVPGGGEVEVDCNLSVSLTGNLR